jgi:HSP20 family molecular chaperone IbpA
MSDKQQMAERGSTDVERREREPEVVLRPPVDIFEDAEGITLQLDMPGVSRDRLEIQADKNNLVIEGSAQIDMPQGMEALYAEVRSTLFRRSFTLSSELEAEKIDASLKDGVLTLRVPKRAELRPRKIEVRAS